MKQDPYSGRFDPLAKILAQQLDGLSKAIRENGGSVPAEWRNVAETTSQALAKVWGRKSSGVFRDLAELCALDKAGGDEFPAERIAAEVFSRPATLPDGTRVQNACSNMNASAEEVVAEGKRQGIKITNLVASRALAAVASRLGLKARRGRRVGSKTGAEANRLRKLRKGREGKGDAGLPEQGEIKGEAGPAEM